MSTNTISLSSTDMATPARHTNVPSPPRNGGRKAASFIILVEMAERFSFYGIKSGLVTYLTMVMGESTATAAKNINVWQGVAFLCPILGAFVADSLIGPFNTVLFSSVIYLLGLILVFLSAATFPSKIRRPAFYLSLYILALGEGGHKPSVQTFAADQFDEATQEEKAAKTSFFNWWFFGIVTGAALGVGSVFFVQKNEGWTAAFGIPAGVMLVALILFIAGIKFYRREGPPATSPFTRVDQVLVAAVRKRGVSQDRWGILDQQGLQLQSGGDTVLVHTHLRWLGKAMILDETDVDSETRNPWRVCTLQEVEQVQQVFRLVPIWLTCFLFGLAYSQLFTFFTKQASAMKNPSTTSSHLQIPAPYIPFFTSIAITLTFILLYERALVPLMRKATGNPTGISTLQRIGVGHILSVGAMLTAALVEKKRVRAATHGGLLISVWWLLPQYGLLGAAEVFAAVGMQQFFYEKMPEELRSLGAAAYLSIVGLGSFLSSGIILVVQTITSKSHQKWLVNDPNKAHLDGFYWLLTVICALGSCAFVWTARGFDGGGEAAAVPLPDQKGEVAAI